MHQKKIVYSGKNLREANKALILLHGRGATAEDILTLSNYLNVNEFALLAPQATNYSWYPYSFLAPRQQNEPWLSSALSVLDEIVHEINQAGIPNERIFFTGFSQGACLTLEFITRDAKQWGGAAAFTGGLIGDTVQPENYSGNFKKTPIFIGSSDPDPHVPVVRVNETVALLRLLHADVTLQIYPNLGHTVAEDELLTANRLIFT